MADFAVWVTACEPACPWPAGTFLRAYAGNRADLVETTLQGNPVAVAVRKLVDRQPSWSGTASELLSALEERVEEREKRAAGWPRRASALAKRLREAATFLRAVGIEVGSSRSGRTRSLSLSRIEDTADLSHPSLPSQSSWLRDSDGDRSPVTPVTPPSHPSQVSDRSGPRVTGAVSLPSPHKLNNGAVCDRSDTNDRTDLPGQGLLVEDLLEGLP